MRFLVIKVFFWIFFAAILARLFYWQVVMAPQLQAQAEKQYYKDIPIGAVRGKIFFSDGSILASSNPSFSLYGLPKLLSKEEKVNLAFSLAKVLSAEKEKVDVLAADLLEKLSQDLYWVQLSKSVSLEEKGEIEDLNLSAIGFDAKSSRFYPEGSSSAHLLGFVGSDAKGEDTGYFGLEGYYDRELRGFSGTIRHERDASGFPILIGNFFSKKGSDGKDLVLNIDPSIQFIAEKTLKEDIGKYGAQAGSVVILNPVSGAVLALAAFPNYHPQSYASYPKEFYKNSVVADQYEPGSTFKVLVMAAAINEDLVKADTECDICGGPIQLGGFTIRTWNNKYFPQSTMQDVIVHSDNTGMVFVGKKLGVDKFYSYLENFGLNKSTEIDLQDESAPDIREKNAWREIDLATASFGQGIAVTPIQMVRAVGAIANGGSLMEPQMVREIKDSSGVFEVRPKVLRNVIKESTAKVITEMMVKAVEEGEAKWAKPKGFKIAGKTGTAQIPVAGHYDPNKTIASFVGFAPADNPKFVMLVRYDQPTTSIYGSETAAPTFFKIAKQLFTYYKIAPSE